MAEQSRGETYGRFEWLSGRSEEALDPATPIVDAHHHLWDLPTSRYLAAELHADVTGSHNITNTVFVECTFGYFSDGPESLRPVGETRAVAAEAKRLAELGSTRLSGIVGHADMTLGSAIGDVLDAHVDAGAGLFRGIRHGTNLSDDPAARRGHRKPTPKMMLSPAFADAARELAMRDLTFDAWMYHDQLHELPVLAAEVPELTIVLNHLGGPLGVGSYAIDPPATRAAWADGIAAVAACPNVVVKVGGLGMDHQFGTGWTTADTPPSSEEVADHWEPWVHESIERFGPNRVIFESNFPVDRQCLTYPVVWNALQRLAGPYPKADQSAMFSGTAARVYRVEAVPSGA